MIRDLRIKKVQPTELFGFITIEGTRELDKLTDKYERKIAKIKKNHDFELFEKDCIIESLEAEVETLKK